MTHHIVRATTTTDDVKVYRIHTNGVAPSWSECAAQIPGFVTGKVLGQIGTDVRRPCKCCQEGANR